MSRSRFVGGLIGLIGLVTVWPAATAGAQPALLAKFGATTIDLSKGWGPAQACLVWRQRGVVECFASEAALTAREAQLRTNTAGRLAPLAPTCSSSLDLYSAANFTGLHLALWDEGYWTNLSLVGFAQRTVSFLGGACTFYLAQGADGGGAWWPGYTGPYGYSTDMGPGWAYTISSVYIV
jgi:hypothetical protein